MTPRWRTGRKVGRTIYLQEGPEPSDQDILIGLMNSPEQAALVVAAVNATLTAADAVHQIRPVDL